MSQLEPYCDTIHLCISQAWRFGICRYLKLQVTKYRHSDNLEVNANAEVAPETLNLPDTSHMFYMK
jgi:hypothetical protein